MCIRDSRRHPDTVYQLWFYVTVPGTGFETPRVHSQIDYRRARGGSDRVTPFLTVDYNVGMLLEDELILTGRVDDVGRLDDSSSESWNYTVVPLVNQSSAHRSTSLSYTCNHSLRRRTSWFDVSGAASVSINVRRARLSLKRFAHLQ